MNVLTRPMTLEMVLLAISGIGITLTLVMFFLARQLIGGVKLKRYRSKAEGFVDLLNYAFVAEEGVVAGKSGALMAAWLVRGSDDASSSETEREMRSYGLNQYFAGRGSDDMFHFECIRRETPQYFDEGLSHFPHRTPAGMDVERRRKCKSAGAMYETTYVLTYTWFPPILAQSKFTEMMFEDDRKGFNERAHTARLLEEFRRRCADLESHLSSVLRLERLKGREVEREDGKRIVFDDLLAHLSSCITGRYHPIARPENPVYLDCILGGVDMFAGVVPLIGRNYVACVAIDGFPFGSYPGMLNELSQLPMEYRWNTRFCCLDSYEAVAGFEKQRKKWRQKIRGFLDQVFNFNSSRVDHDAVSMVEDAEQAIAEINSGMVGVGYYTSAVVILNEDRDELESQARQVEKVINNLGFHARIETINTVDAFIGSLPGHGFQNIRRPLVNTMNLADLLPTSSIWSGERSAPCPMYPAGSPAVMLCKTTGSTPFYFNFHVRDVGHTWIQGPTGSGKSVALNTFAAQLLRYPGMSVYMFDKGLSAYALCKAVGGRHYSLAADNEALSFCTLHFLSTASDRSWASGWMDSILALNGVATTAEQRNEIARSITSMYETGSETLTDFRNTVQDDSIRAALGQYTGDGLMGHLLDAREDGLEFSNYNVFEVEELMNAGEKYCLPVLLYLFRRIERSLQGQPAAIFLDEAWLMLSHPVFREKIREWLKVMRKANCAVIMATQSLTDAARSEILDVIVESTATKIFLPNVYARDEDTANLYRRMGLNDTQIDIVARAIPKREYYYVSEKGRRLFDLALGPLALSFVGASDKESVATIRALENRYGEGWMDEWLKMRGAVPG